MNTSSNKLASDIISVAQYLQDGVGVKLVIIGQLIRLMQFASCKNFNNTVKETNQLIKELNAPSSGIHFWGPTGFWKDLHYLGPDGVHLLCTPAEDQPMRKYRRSIGNAVGNLHLVAFLFLGVLLLLNVLYILKKILLF